MIEISAQGCQNGVGEVLIHGYITSSRWYEDDVSATSFDKAVKALGPGLKVLNIHINSYGGSCDAGQAIVSMVDALRAKGVYVVAYIEGIAASMATVVPQAADKIVMADNAMMMVHKPIARAAGNADVLEKAVQLLDKYEERLVALYMRRFTGEEQALRDMLREETWLNAEEALGYGFCDEINGVVDVAACADGFSFNGLELPSADLQQAIDRILPTGKGGEKEMEKTEVAAVAGIVGDAGPRGDRAEQSAFSIGGLAGAMGVEAESLQTDGVLAGIALLAAQGIALDDPAPGLAALRAQAEPSPELLGKAAAYEQIVDEAINEALKNGVRAKAETFDEARWRKAFASFTLAEIQAQGAEWHQEAAEELRAGVRVSTVPEAQAAAVHNPDEYRV